MALESSRGFVYRRMSRILDSYMNLEPNMPCFTGIFKGNLGR